jgi:hypothetical protein
MTGHGPALPIAFSVRVVRFVRQAPESHGSHELFEAPQEFLILVVCALRPQPLTINFLLPLPLFPFPHCRVERKGKGRETQKKGVDID